MGGRKCASGLQNPMTTRIMPGMYPSVTATKTGTARVAASMFAWCAGRSGNDGSAAERLHESPVNEALEFVAHQSRQVGGTLDPTGRYCYTSNHQYHLLEMADGSVPIQENSDAWEVQLMTVLHRTAAVNGEKPELNAISFTMVVPSRCMGLYADLIDSISAAQEARQGAVAKLLDRALQSSD
jgi:hypothetical protein